MLLLLFIVPVIFRCISGLVFGVKYEDIWSYIIMVGLWVWITVALGYECVTVFKNKVGGRTWLGGSVVKSGGVTARDGLNTIGNRKR